MEGDKNINNGNGESYFNRSDELGMIGNFNSMDGRTYGTQEEADAADLAYKQDPQASRPTFIPNQKI